MIDLLPEIQEWLAAGEELALATVVRVAGSAPRPVGARMIISSEGRMAGSVSGGCVETTVYEEMMDLLQGGPPRLLHFGITEDMIWDVGLACGGTIDVFVQRLDPALTGKVARLAAAKEGFVLATILSGPGMGTTHLVDGGDTGLDEGLAAAAREALAARREQGIIQAVGLDREVFVEASLPPPQMIIIGGVHAAIPLTRFAKELGFTVIVADPRAKFANRERFPEADQVFQEWPDEALAHLKVDESTYIVLLTHDPKIDEPTLAAALKTPAAYVGAIGSRGTHAGRRERMASWGVSPEELQRVYGPIGLDVGGRSPQETALAIMAEVIAVKNGKSGGFLRDKGRS
jgi:xanthine dehydrogenase accessory factor